jgi:hypothetical protein
MLSKKLVQLGFDGQLNVQQATLDRAPRKDLTETRTDYFFRNFQIIACIHQYLEHKEREIPRKRRFEILTVMSTFGVIRGAKLASMVIKRHWDIRH